MNDAEAIKFDATADPAIERGWRILSFVLPYLWPKDRPGLRFRVIFALACLGGGIGFAALVPFLLKWCVDALTAAAGTDSPSAAVIVAVPVALIVLYGVVRAMQQGFRELRDAVFSSVGQHAVRELARVTFEHVHQLSLRFHLQRQTGGLNRIIDRGTKAIDFLLRFTLFNVIPTVLQVLIFCGILLVNYDILFAVTTLATILVFVIFTLIVTNWRLRLRRDMNNRDAEANTKAVDSLLNFETVKYFGNEGHETRRFDQSMAGYQFAAVRSQVSLAALNFGQSVIVSTGLVIVMLLAGRGVAAGTMSIGDFVLINAFLIQLYVPLNFLGMVYREIRQAIVDLEKMHELVNVVPDIRNEDGAPEIKIAGGEVSFRDVSFAYNPGQPILRSVSFRAAPGQTVAFVGPSGGGKSTIARLLFRFYDVDSGAVEIDGQDLRAVTQGSIRAAIGVVPQDTVLFNDTIGYNIGYGKPGASDDDILKAAGLAQLGNFIAGLPNGLQTVVGERGLKLSGGEKQRVAIARAILKDPAILLFDEATSALDSETEKEILGSLRAISANRTTLIIAHRLSTIVDADKILVIEGGRVVEQGRHESLLQAGGRYAEMWARQQADEDRRPDADLIDQVAVAD